tara:strand:- start:683 stop:952 length:270 start_codon:yes stop_codon:yes gene_type:complete
MKRKRIQSDNETNTKRHLTNTFYLEQQIKKELTPKIIHELRNKLTPVIINQLRHELTEQVKIELKKHFYEEIRQIVKMETDYKQFSYYS